MQLNEDFLQYVWKYRLLTRRDVYCTNGELLRIIHPGALNSNAGPDFSTAKLVIGGQSWVGDVEIHNRSSDWIFHGHQQDKSYDKVILHAVYEEDEVICRTDGTTIPVLVLKGLIPESLRDNYEKLMGGNFFPCEKQIGLVNQGTVAKMLDQMIIERFIEKTAQLDEKMSQNNHYWNETFYGLLMRNFGFKVNAVPFELLAAGLPITILAKHRDNPLQVEALLFGQAGFLEGDFKDDYPRKLKAEYLFLRKKYLLIPGEPSIWKFMRMHPQNFPVLRIAQAAGLLRSREHLFTDLLQETDLKKLISIFSQIAVHPYWKTHSNFDRECKPMSVKLGRKSIENLIINTICQMQYCYGNYFKLTALTKRSIFLLKNIPAEQNVILLKYCKAGAEVSSAYESQAVLQLNKNWCSQKKCLNCRIGVEILNK